MLQAAKEARTKMITSIRQQYGDYFDAIFSHGFIPISPQSTQRLVRKLQIKALQVQTKFAKEEQAGGKSKFDATIEACKLRLRPKPVPSIGGTTRTERVSSAAAFPLGSETL